MNHSLLKENILTELLWEPDDMSWIGPPAQASFRGMVKANRKLVYRDDEGSMATGYCSKTSMLYEPFAIYIKELFGDGIYFFHENDETTYFLIVSRGRIVSGTDCFIARSLFDTLIAHSEKYKHLDVTPLTHSHLNAVVEQCRIHQASLKRRRRLIMTTLLSAGAIFLIVLTLILHFYVNG